jgi:hypothetical protein
MQSAAKSRTKLLAVALISALAGAAIGGTAMAGQPHMVNARADLEAALQQLQIAKADKGGHRDNAINLVNHAITEVNAGIAYAE